MGWYIITPVTLIKENSDSPIAIIVQDLFGEGFGELKVAHLSTGDRIGIEFFEFPQTHKEKYVFNPFKTGIFHYCVQDPNLEDLVNRIIKAGGEQRMPIRYCYPGEAPYRMVTMEDPFGNMVQIYSHSYELHYSSEGYK